LRYAIHLALLAMAANLGACANLTAPQDAFYTGAKTSLIAEGRTASPPPGFISFCMHNLARCQDNDAAAPSQLALTAENRSMLEAVNERVNRAIAYKGDRENWSVANFWNLDALGKSGDCKDYALAKQQVLIAAGLPQKVLRIAIVKTPKNELHAVLTVDTDQGAFVLDSINPQIMPWTETSYSWLSRQSAQNPLAWVTIASAY